MQGAGAPSPAPEYLPLEPPASAMSDAPGLLDEPVKSTRRLLVKLNTSFFLFGLINNVLYVIILSAALDLVPPSTPKGIIAFCNIFPALIAKIGWPYILRGRIRYRRRLIGCCLISFVGMLIVAAFDSLDMRLLGICCASFSSGLGELTFLQLSTTYSRKLSGISVGYFASGTGAAGLVGALLWWEVRGLGVREGVGLSSVLPFVIPATYFFLLPRNDQFDQTVSDLVVDESATPVIAYAPLPHEADDEVVDVVEEDQPQRKSSVALSLSDKWRLVRPLLTRYMLPLFCVYVFEYTINQGIAPTLIYPVPTPSSNPFLSHIIKSLRDYYPLWQLVYQTFVFFSRSSISIGIPPMPARLLPLPALVQSFILTALALESAFGILQDDSAFTILVIFLLIGMEGICGGLAYVNVFYRIGQEDRAGDEAETEKSRQEREFRIGSIGFSDSLGILCASLLSVPMEISLCGAQVRRGKMLCKEL